MTAGARLQQLEARELSTLSAAEATAALRDLSVIRGATDQLEAALVRDGTSTRPPDLRRAVDAWDGTR